MLAIVHYHHLQDFMFDWFTNDIQKAIALDKGYWDYWRKELESKKEIQVTPNLILKGE